MTIGRTNSGSGGGISSNAALLVVYAPLGSIVTATKDGVTKTSKKGIALSDRPTVEIHLISIGSSQFGTWAVTATRGTDTNTTTISVSAVKRYELYIGYHVPLQTYQEVKYLKGTGTQYIILPNVRVENVRGGKFKYRKTADVAWSFLWGGGQNTTYAQNGLGFQTTSGDGRYGLYYMDTQCVRTPIEANVDYTVEFTCVSGAQTVTIDNTVYRGTIPGTPSSPNGIAIFCYRYASAIKTAEISKNRVNYFMLYDSSNNKLVELYPCYRLSDSVAGMWDKVSNTFFTNNGSGTFTVGSDV